MRFLAFFMLCLATFVMGWALRGRPESEVPVLRAELERTRIELLRAREELLEARGVPAESLEPRLESGAGAAPAAAQNGGATPPGDVPPAVAAERADYLRLATGGAGPAEWRALIERLAADGSEPAVGVLLEMMGDARVGVTPQLYADLLRDVQDPRLGPFAGRQLDRVLAGDRTRTSEVRAWMDLLATHLDADGAQRLLGWLGEQDQVGTLAAQHAGRLLAFTDVQDVLGAASEIVREGPALYASLAATKDPDALIALETMLYAGEGAPAGRAVLVGSAIGSVLDVEGLARWAERFWTSDALGRAAVMHVLAGTDGNPDLSAEDKRTLAFPILEFCLQDPQDPLLMPALRRLEYDGAFHTPLAIGPLEGLRDLLPVESPERAYAMRVLAKIQKTLAVPH